MGTYDTRGGHPISPPDNDIAPTELEEKVWLLLDDAGFEPAAIDKIMELIEAEEKRIWLELEKEHEPQDA